MTSGGNERPSDSQTAQGSTETLDTAGLARLLHLSVATVRADISRRPWTLPPFIKLGTKTVWLHATVMDWLKARERAATPPATTEPPQQSRRRGRPSKLEQLQQQRERAAKASA